MLDINKIYVQIMSYKEDIFSDCYEFDDVKSAASWFNPSYRKWKSEGYSSEICDKNNPWEEIKTSPNEKLIKGYRLSRDIDEEIWVKIFTLQ